MSLKSFHIVFISVSTLCAFGFGAWLLFANAVDQSWSNVAGGIVSFLVGFALVAYGVRFLKKFRHLSYM
ncbi:MAG: hypothetical protein HW374_1196 [Bacteroidetes bacterium]|nr:hypothetical protein [Bacteroidota bacterium]